MTVIPKIGVYIWTNSVNQKCYVGSSINMPRCRNEHLRALHCEVCSVAIMPLKRTMQTIKRLHGRKHCSRACANKSRALQKQVES